MKIDAYETSALMNSAARPAQVFVEGRRADCFEAGDQGGTHCGNPLMAAVGCAVLDVVAQPSFLAGVRERAARMQAVLATHAARIGGDLRSAGLLQALFTADAHGLYRRIGFTPLAHLERGMERLRTDLYTSS